MADYWSGLGAPFETFTLGDWTFLEVERRTPWHQAGWSQVHVSISCCYPSPRASGIRRTHRSTNSLHLGIWRCIPWAFHVFSCSSLPLAFTLQTQVWLGSGTSQWIQHDSTIFSELLVSGPIPVILSTAWMIHLPRTHGFELRGATWTRASLFLRPFFGGMGLNMVDLFGIICNSFCNHFKWFWIVIWIPCLSPQWLWLTMLWLIMFESPIQTR